MLILLRHQIPHVHPGNKQIPCLLRRVCKQAQLIVEFVVQRRHKFVRILEADVVHEDVEKVNPQAARPQVQFAVHFFRVRFFAAH